jgi:hypothetical protein
MNTYDTWLKMPLMRPVPIPTPKSVKWYDVVGQIKMASYRMETRNWRIETDYLFFIPWLNVEVCIPGGFVFDGASIPRPLWSFMAPTGIMFIPGLFHDFGYRYNCWLDKNYNPIFIGEGQNFFDENFKKIGIYTNDATNVSTIAWGALKVFGFIAWNSHRKEGNSVESDFPPKV